MQGQWYSEFDAKVFTVEREIVENPLLSDTSWKNDMSPSFSTLDISHAAPQEGLENDGLIVWCDAPRRWNREDDLAARYTITRPEGGTTYDPHGENAFVLSTDSLDEVLNFVEAHTFELWRSRFAPGSDELKFQIDEVAPAGYPRDGTLSWDRIREDLVAAYGETRREDESTREERLRSEVQENTRRIVSRLPAGHPMADAIAARRNLGDK